MYVQYSMSKSCGRIDSLHYNVAGGGGGGGDEGFAVLRRHKLCERLSYARRTWHAGDLEGQPFRLVNSGSPIGLLMITFITQLRSLVLLPGPCHVTGSGAATRAQNVLFTVVNL